MAGVEEHLESAAYLQKRQLKSGSAGWLLLAGLGVSYVVSGDYSGWNFGLAQGGFGGLAIAAVVIAGMYLALVLGMAELSSALPAAGGGYTFARRALGPWGGFATGTAILIEYSIAPAAIATFIGAYVESLGLFGITNGWWVYLAAYALFIGIHLSGVGEALKVMFVITAIALVGLVVFAVAAIGHFDVANLTNIAVDSGAAGASEFLPHGYLGIWAAIPFAIWFFLAVEGVPLAAEETANPERNVPRGIIAAIAVLLVSCAVVLVLTTGAGGAEEMSDSGNPLVEALGDGTAAKLVNYIGLAGLIASFFSIIYAYSRQLFALSRAGYLPTALSVTNSRKAPTLALIIPGIIGFILSLTGQGALLLNMAVFGAALSYVLMMISHIVLRVREPNMPRPYRTPGGAITTGFALVIAVLAVIATFLVDPVAAGWCLAVFAGFMVYFAVYSRHRLVANSPDEEFAMLAQAESELK
ncbi:putative ethanolamine permease [Mycolicibacterium mageritense DSM 44476 = CIP 104973]|uniref:Amino acid permease YhdG n=1 Tax=Mycolicibacterium mageritense TaxID=53462 RepID=A0AAI8TWZ3_MYCME|nr:ethanolamine permease [Mycolicibacterium mageritense]MBN3452668.1 ethanolamine permease [Mycobacterium sp. DSM 3803]OKH79394.1 ethanolamine transporter [Mycobacterium sp. SWH-M3]MCC9185800.1 ethanolamine permease [Mycolicibacterium mageritense]TXI63461.1 MAG: ethanolamine permease [Mycolicibacterium mageritense]CDO20342.1 putative ethanolamine permease [Mycolicibacterium mageritense DSM 44476 = CIP 104973]